MLTFMNDYGRSCRRQLTRARTLLMTIRCQSQRDELKSWIETAEKRSVKFADLCPNCFTKPQKNIGVIEVSGSDYKMLAEDYRLIERFGRSADYLFNIEECSDVAKQIRSFFLSVQLTGHPGKRTFVAELRGRSNIEFSILVLPAVNDDEVVSHLAAVFDFPDSVQNEVPSPNRQAARILTHPAFQTQTG